MLHIQVLQRNLNNKSPLGPLLLQTRIQRSPQRKIDIFPLRICHVQQTFLKNKMCVVLYVFLTCCIFPSMKHIMFWHETWSRNSTRTHKWNIFHWSPNQYSNTPYLKWKQSTFIQLYFQFTTDKTNVSARKQKNVVHQVSQLNLIRNACWKRMLNPFLLTYKRMLERRELLSTVR